MKKKSALWFWLFWLLIVGLVSGGCYSAYLAFSPSKVSLSQPSKNTAATFDINLNRDQVNALASSYLQDSGNGDFTFVANQNNVVLSGKLSILGQNIDAKMAMMPEATSDGNIVLKAQSISLGQISLPVNVAMGYIKQMYNGPSYVQFQPNQEKIIIDLNKATQNQNMRFKATKIDLNQGQFQFVGEVVNGKK